MAELALADEMRRALQIALGVRIRSDGASRRGPVMFSPLGDGSQIACSPRVETMGGMRMSPPPSGALTSCPPCCRTVGQGLPPLGGLRGSKAWQDKGPFERPGLVLFILGLAVQREDAVAQELSRETATTALNL